MTIILDTRFTSPIPPFREYQILTDLITRHQSLKNLYCATKRRYSQDIRRLDHYSSIFSLAHNYLFWGSLPFHGATKLISGMSHN